MVFLKFKPDWKTEDPEIGKDESNIGESVSNNKKSKDVQFLRL